MKSLSNNTYETSDGIRLTRKHIESRIRRAKQEVIETQLYEAGFNHCQACGKSRGEPLDCAHVLPVAKCLSSGMAELAYKPENIRILCRTCHREHDGLSLQFTVS